MHLVDEAVGIVYKQSVSLLYTQMLHVHVSDPCTCLCRPSKHRKLTRRKLFSLEKETKTAVPLKKGCVWAP